MTALRLILVAHDFGPHSDAALQTAIAWAGAANAKIHLVHSFAPPIALLSPYDEVFPAEAFEAVRDSAQKRLDELKAAVAAKGVEASAELSTAFPSDAILVWRLRSMFGESTSASTAAPTGNSRLNSSS